MHPSPITNRRSVLKLLAATTAAPLILPGRLFGQNAPSKKITLGCIGVGWQGGANLDSFLALDDCQVVAICDVDEAHLKAAVAKVNARYGNQDCKGYKDFNELIARKDIDAVSICTPDPMRQSLSRIAPRIMVLLPTFMSGRCSFRFSAISASVSNPSEPMTTVSFKWQCFPMRERTPSMQ